MKAAIYCRVGTDNQNAVAQFIGTLVAAKSI